MRKRDQRSLMKISRSLLKAKIKIFDECIFNTNKKDN